MKISTHILTICLLTIITLPSYGSYLFNNRDTIVGGKAALLGSAYTALSEDLSGAYYNPAGIVSSDTITELPLTIYAWKRIERLNATENNYFLNTASTLSTLPTILGKIWKLSNKTANEFFGRGTIFYFECF